MTRREKITIGKEWRKRRRVLVRVGFGRKYLGGPEVAYCMPKGGGAVVPAMEAGRSAKYAYIEGVLQVRGVDRGPARVSMREKRRKRPANEVEHLRGFNIPGILDHVVHSIQEECWRNGGRFGPSKQLSELLSGDRLDDVQRLREAMEAHEKAGDGGQTRSKKAE